MREDRATTKVCIVYDARANKNGPSLNEMLETGPCIVFKVFEILLRAICHKISFSKRYSIRVFKYWKESMKYLFKYLTKESSNRNCR